jgi:hypothetical protein
MADNKNILRRPWRMKPRVVMINKLKLDLARSFSSSDSVSTSPTSTWTFVKIFSKYSFSYKIYIKSMSSV